MANQQFPIGLEVRQDAETAVCRPQTVGTLRDIRMVRREDVPRT